MEGEEHLRDIREVNRRDWNENVFARPNGQRENAEAIISCRRSGPPRKNTSSREEEKDAQMCPCGKAKESSTHVVGECEKYNEERDVLEEMWKIGECDGGDIQYTRKSARK